MILFGELPSCGQPVHDSPQNQQITLVTKSARRLASSNAANGSVACSATTTTERLELYAAPTWACAFVRPANEGNRSGLYQHRISDRSPASRTHNQAIRSLQSAEISSRRRLQLLVSKELCVRMIF